MHVGVCLRMFQTTGLKNWENGIRTGEKITPGCAIVLSLVQVTGTPSHQNMVWSSYGGQKMDTCIYQLLSSTGQGCSLIIHSFSFSSCAYVSTTVTQVSHAIESEKTQDRKKEVCSMNLG